MKDGKIRDVLVSGRSLHDEAGRWWCEWSMGMPPTAAPVVSFSRRGTGPGQIPGRRRAFNEGTEWAFRVRVTDKDAKGVHGGYSQRVRNEQAVKRLLMLGADVPVAIKWDGGRLETRAVVTSDVVPEESTFERVSLVFTMRLFEGRWVKGAPRVDTIRDGLIPSLQGGSSSARCAWRFPGPINQGVQVYQGDQLVLDWHGKVAEGQALVVDKLNWWLVDDETTEWWNPTELGSPMNLDQHDEYWPDTAGRYACRVLVDGVEAQPGVIQTRGTQTWL